MFVPVHSKLYVQLHAVHFMTMDGSFELQSNETVALLQSLVKTPLPLAVSWQGAVGSP